MGQSAGDNLGLQMMAGVGGESCSAGPLTSRVWNYPQIGNVHTELSCRKPSCCHRSAGWCWGNKTCMLELEEASSLLSTTGSFLVAIANVFMLDVYFKVRSFKEDTCGEGFNWTWKGSSFSLVSMAIPLSYEQ